MSTIGNAAIRKNPLGLICTNVFGKNSATIKTTDVDKSVCKKSLTPSDISHEAIIGFKSRADNKPKTTSAILFPNNNMAKKWDSRL